MNDKQRKAYWAKQNKASVDSKILSHHFGTADIDARGTGNYTINFGKRGYELLSNKKIDSFEKKYPNAKLNIVPKDKKIHVSGM